ncbi:riboflavin synthase [Georgenia thermotolerans]|uniref:Riboflavin synthase n=1 Tax=Georgenia thermotolerans TaxID=527326 RepID=A0A7J5UL08_9MICO|nr:riboflavin synthase [Georgenia thermotolerans]KAE8762960.1 riboflavin synthase [Georgenia thermotolerans]
MFTGLVEEVGTVRERREVDGAVLLTVAASTVTADLAPGDSVAVAGVCLTVTDPRPDGFVADVMPETLDRTTLGCLTPGAPVNLERAVAPHTRLGGHIVQGHVDGVGTVRSRTPGPRWDDLEIALPPELARYVAEKGSIAVEGVSLTVTHVSDDAFGVSLIPTTLAATTLGTLAPGSGVNLEVDVVAKYVERLLATSGAAR